MAEPEKFDDHDISLSIARASEAAALAAGLYIGLGDEMAMTEASVQAAIEALNRMPFDGRIVIGEGDEGDADTLFTGQTVGTGNGPRVDIAIDPLEGRTLAVKDQPNALSVIAVAQRGTMLETPDIYMEKLAIGPGYPDGLITLEMPTADKIAALSKAKEEPPHHLTICVLDRPRHSDLVAEIRATGARVRLIDDGDVAAIMHCAAPLVSGVDMYLGSGGAAQGVLAAAALKCLGGQMQTRFVLRNGDDAALLRAQGLENSAEIMGIDDMVAGDVVFAATGVTNGPTLAGLRRAGPYFEAETLLLRSRTGATRRLSYRRRIKEE